MGYWKVNRNRDKSKPIFERRLASVVFEKKAAYGGSSPINKSFWITPDGKTIPVKYHLSAVEDYITERAKQVGIPSAQQQHTKHTTGQPYPERGDTKTLLKNKGLTDAEASLLLNMYPGGAITFALKELGWIRVRGRDIETYSLTSQLLNSLTTALESMYGVDACENTLFNIEVHSPRNFFEDVPYHVLKSGSGLGRYKEGFGKNSQNYTLNKKFWITGKGEVLDVPHTHYETALEYVIGGSREFVTNLRRQNIPGSVLKEKYGLSDEKIRIIKGITPVTDYLMKNEGWIRVNGGYLNLETLDSKTRNLIDKGFRTAYGDQCEDFILNVVDVEGARRVYCNVPFYNVVSGTGLGDYRESFSKYAQTSKVVQ